MVVHCERCGEPLLLDDEKAREKLKKDFDLQNQKIPLAILFVLVVMKN